MTDLRAEGRASAKPAATLPWGLSLRKNVGWSVIGNLSFAATQWLVLIVLAQLGSAADVGMWTLATALVTPIFMLCDMALMDAHTVDDLTKFRRSDYVALRMIGALTASFLCLAAAYIWFWNQPELFAATIALISVKFVHSQAVLNTGMYQREQRADFLAKSAVSRGIVGLSFFAGTYWFSQSLWMAILAQALGWALILFFVDRRYMKQLGTLQSLKVVLATKGDKLLHLFLWTLPLALSSAVVAATASAPRLVLGSLTDLATVGVFGAISFFHTGTVIPINAISIASASRLRAMAKNGKRRPLLRLSLRLVALTTSIALAIYLGGWMFGQVVLGTVYGAEYVNQKLLMIVLTATVAHAALAPLQSALMAGHMLWRRFLINTASFAATLAAAIALVPEHGIYGAAAALVIGSSARAVLLVVFFLRLIFAMQSVPNEEGT